MTDTRPLAVGDKVTVSDSHATGDAPVPGTIVSMGVGGLPEISYTDAVGVERIDRFHPSQISRTGKHR